MFFWTECQLRIGQILVWGFNSRHAHSHKRLVCGHQIFPNFVRSLFKIGLHVSMRLFKQRLNLTKSPYFAKAMLRFHKHPYSLYKDSEQNLMLMISDCELRDCERICTIYAQKNWVFNLNKYILSFCKCFLINWLVTVRSGWYDIKFISLFFLFIFYSEGIISLYHKNERDTPLKTCFHLFSLC